MKAISVSVFFVVCLLVQSCGSSETKPNQQTSNLKSNTSFNSKDEPSSKEKALRDYVELGGNYLSQGNRKQARYNYLKALGLNNSSPQANNGIALLYQSEGEWERAETHYKKAITSDAKFISAHNNYARFLTLQKRYKEAKKHYQLASEDYHYALRPQAFVGLSVAQFYLNDLDGAKESLNRALRLNPRLTVAMIQLGDLCFESKDYICAQQQFDAYESATNHSPRSLWLGIRLARIFEEHDREAGYALALKNLYPTSQQAREYILLKKAERNE